MISTPINLIDIGDITWNLFWLFTLLTHGSIDITAIALFRVKQEGKETPRLALAAFHKEPFACDNEERRSVGKTKWDVWLNFCSTEYIMNMHSL